MPDMAGNHSEDAALVEQALNGDDKAMAQLIAVAMPIARAKALALEADCNRLAVDDLVQEGMFGFMDALRTYSPEGGAAFRTYVNKCIGNRILSAVGRHHNTKNSALTHAFSLADDEGSFVPQSPDPFDAVAERERYDRLMAFLQDEKELSAMERRVIHLRLQGFSYAEVATQLGVTEKAVDNALQRVKKKMRAKL